LRLDFREHRHAVQRDKKPMYHPILVEKTREPFKEYLEIFKKVEKRHIDEIQNHSEQRRRLILQPDVCKEIAKDENITKKCCIFKKEASIWTTCSAQ
jgi:hypothetical protein